MSYPSALDEAKKEMEALEAKAKETIAQLKSEESEEGKEYYRDQLKTVKESMARWTEIKKNIEEQLVEASTTGGKCSLPCQRIPC